VKTIIGGCRHLVDYEKMKTAIELSGFEVTEVVSGGARGGDALGERWAMENGVPIRRFKANWRDGVRAGFRRNELMARYAEALVAVWDGTSSGTGHMIKEARKMNLKVFVFFDYS